MLWLEAIHEKKESTLLESTNMLKDMEDSIIVYESYVDFYDELINDCLKISLDVSRELTDLRIAGAFNEVIQIRIFMIIRSAYVCIYINICMYIHKYIYIYIYIYMLTDLRIAGAFNEVCLCTYVYIYIYMYINMHMYICIMHMYIYTYMYMYICKHMRIYRFI
jgi:hypothetical protein